MKSIAAVTFTLLLGACASTPVTVNLVPSEVPRAQQRVDAELKTVTVTIADEAQKTGEVRMNATFPPLWRDAVSTAVDQAGIFKDDSPRKVTIRVIIKKYQYNPTGFSNTLDIDADYSVVDRSTGSAIYQSVISNSGATDTSEAWNANERLVRLWNRVTQENIKMFVTALEGAKLP